MTRLSFQNVHGVEEFAIDLVDEHDSDDVSTLHHERRRRSTNIPVFASTVQKTKAWLKELMVELEWRDGPKTYRALSVVLHAVRDRMTIQEASDLSAQLPMLIRGMFFEGWMPQQVPLKDRSIEGFLAHVADQFGDTPNIDPQQLTRAVWTVMSRHISAGELDDIRAVVPGPLKKLLSTT
jgi:uncharacterized protein (DUF2267 family)